MKKLTRAALVLLAPAAVAGLVVVASSRGVAQDDNGDEAFPQLEHPLIPQPEWTRVAYGAVSQAEEDEIAAMQPIAYSHKLHAGELAIDCQYCHSNARRTIHAGVPGTHVCMNCHQYVDMKCKVGDPANPAECKTPRATRTDGEHKGKTELEVLKDYWDKKEPIPWVRVHDLPDFVYFSHKRHVQGGLDCTECHGPVKDEYTLGRRFATLEMGWCLECHENHPAVDENYGEDAELRRAELKDCWTCHK